MNDKVHHQPLGGNQMPRFGGPATMMRLPSVAGAKGLDACFVGVPFDIGTSNRAGARFAPRQIRAESCLIRPYNMATRAAPFDSLQVADIGDVATNPYDLKDSIRLIEAAYDRIVVIAGDSIPDGDYSPNGVAMRINDRGFDYTYIRKLVGKVRNEISHEIDTPG